MSKNGIVYVESEFYDVDNDPDQLMYWKYAWCTRNDFAKYIDRYSTENNLDFKDAFKWFLSMLVHSYYIKKSFPQLRRPKYQTKLFNRIGLGNEQYWKIFDAYEAFREKVCTRIEEDVSNLKFFKKEAQGEILGMENVQVIDNKQLVDILLIIGFLVDVELNLDKLETMNDNSSFIEYIEDIRLDPRSIWD